MMCDEVLEVQEARQLAKQLLEEGRVVYRGHARREMEQDNISQKDIERTLRGVCEPAEWENEEWRYRFYSYDVWAVTTFQNDSLVIIVTAWRKK